MLAIRDFLLSVLGGTEFMWDVALGVVLAGLILLVLYLIFAIAISLIRAGNRL